MFKSYEAGRQDHVTFLMTVNALQAPFGGPNYFPLPSDFVFNIHVERTGDGQEDLTFAWSCRAATLSWAPGAASLTSSTSGPTTPSGSARRRTAWATPLSTSCKVVFVSVWLRSLRPPAQFIDLTEKDRWNYEHPSQESQFLEYYQYPTLPELVEVLFGATVRGATGITASVAPNVYPRVDLAVVLLQGVPGLTQQTLVGTPQCGALSARRPLGSRQSRWAGRCS